MEDIGMSLFCDRFEGTRLGGKYLLRQCVEEGVQTACFLASAGEGARAVVRLERAGEEAAARRAVWKRLASLPHRHVIRILEVGEAEEEGTRILWVAMECPDENLGDVLRTRALSEEEAREALAAAADGLAHLHAHGLVMGGLTPWSVVAVGDTVKIPADGARQAGALKAGGDVRALGLTACEMLIRRVPEVADGVPRLSPSEAAAIAPLETFVRRCLEGGWSAASLAAWLRKPEADAPSAPEPAPLPAAPAAAAARPAEFAEPAKPMRWVWVACALCLVVLVLVALATARKGEPAAAPAPPAAPPLPPAAEEARGVPPASTAARWRVVAYTYAGREAALQRARSINGRFPEFRAEVFTPRGEGPPYLVSLGGRMTRQEAVELQRAARRNGLPRDTYIRNYRR